jgi:hypothetical protein
LLGKFKVLVREIRKMNIVSIWIGGSDFRLNITLYGNGCRLALRGGIGAIVSGCALLGRRCDRFDLSRRSGFL